MRIVADASVLLKWFVQEEGADVAAMLLDEHELSAPVLVLAEVLNAAWKKQRLGQIDDVTARGICRRVAPPLVRLAALEDLAPRAWRLARELDHPVYDCFYLALAEQDDATMVTADRRLLARLAGTGWADRVKSLREWAG
ncbi:MAG TPA: type II toxin-antitoxin system VapC family toxin [Geminicoccaceae bacterium]|nr:type II toxin-antitoxin system VapC family toxin [Geminicoccaceae bacterium]